jgi:large subunit ribosomal protein L13
MDMNKGFILKKEDITPKWHVVDASGKVLGRLCTQIANVLRGKDNPMYTSHVDSGDYVIVINCKEVRMTGDKWASKIYRSYSGWRGGLKKATAREVFNKDATVIIKHAVKGMLPKNKLNRKIIKKLKVYPGQDHPHKAQVSS